MKDLPPANERRLVRLAGEGRDERADERELSHHHAHVRRHLEGAKLDDPLPAVGRLRIEELVDADLGAVGVAGEVDEEVAEERVAEPGVRTGTGTKRAGERDSSS